MCLSAPKSWVAAERSFFCLKFQTMRPEADVLHQSSDSNPQARAEWQTSRKLRNDPRITLIGRKLMGVAENIIRQIEQRVAYASRYQQLGQFGSI